jgi:WD40 repeat protein
MFCQADERNLPVHVCVADHFTLDSRYVTITSGVTLCSLYDMLFLLMSKSGRSYMIDYIGQQLGNYHLTFYHTAPVRVMAWSPNGKSIASGGGDTNIQVWVAP